MCCPHSLHMCLSDQVLVCLLDGLLPGSRQGFASLLASSSLPDAALSCPGAKLSCAALTACIHITVR